MPLVPAKLSTLLSSFSYNTVERLVEEDTRQLRYGVPWTKHYELVRF